MAPSVGPSALPTLKADWFYVEARFGPSIAFFTTRVCNGTQGARDRKPPEDHSGADERRAVDDSHQAKIEDCVSERERSDRFQWLPVPEPSADHHASGAANAEQQQHDRERASGDPCFLREQRRDIGENGEGRSADEKAHRHSQ
jgi:hypothetical protein